MTKNTTQNSQSKHTCSILTNCTVVTGDHLWTRAGAAVMVEQLALLWLKRIQLGGLWTNQLVGLIRLSRNSQMFLDCQLETLNPVWGTRYCCWNVCDMSSVTWTLIVLQLWHLTHQCLCLHVEWMTDRHLGSFGIFHKLFWPTTTATGSCRMKQERDFGTV